MTANSAGGFVGVVSNLGGLERFVAPAFWSARFELAGAVRILPTQPRAPSLANGYCFTYDLPRQLMATSALNGNGK